jgi:hypothetical protein
MVLCVQVNFFFNYKNWKNLKKKSILIRKIKNLLELNLILI